MTHADDDAVLPFQLDAADMRGRLARLDDTLETILAQHAYPDAISALLAEAALLTAMIGQAIKLRWRLSLQVRGDGPVRLIATDYFAPETDDAPATLRAYAGFDAERFDPARAAFAQLGKGYFAVVIDQGQGTTPYQGVTPLTGAGLGDCAATYFAQSEQLATSFALCAARSAAPGEAERWRGGGIMLQHLPKSAPSAAPGAAPDAAGEARALGAGDVAAMHGAEEDWRRVNMLLGTLEPHELLGPVIESERVLARLFHEETPRIWPARPIAFGCTCSAERVRAALAQYSAKDIATMTTEAGAVTADCQFCGAHYRFDPATLGFEAEAPLSGSA